MLLTISTTHRPATDIGFLLHKNPENLHQVSLAFGEAHVFYPEATQERCTAALLLDVDPVALVRKNTPSGEGFSLEQYVNDRPYAASSLMSVAIGKMFGTLISGKCKDRPELVDQALPLEVRLPVLPCRGGRKLLRRLFEPLGYDVKAVQHGLDDKFPAWGESAYYTVTLRRSCPLREFLIHLYVLVPVLDNDKHYWIGEDEIDKLLKFGEGWLSAHPEKDLITKRYLKHFQSLVNNALARLSEDQPVDHIDEYETGAKLLEPALETKINLQQARLEWVLAKFKACNARRVVDLGCGEGELLSELLKDHYFEQIVGCDVSMRALEIARQRLKVDRLPEFHKKRIQLFQAALSYRDQRLEGFDAAALIEVIEHMDLPRLDALGRVVFEFARPCVVLITTPNREFNALFENLREGNLRHPDHRFEWTRAQFEAWSKGLAQQFGYSVTFEGIGSAHSEFGTPTQAGVFIRND